MATLPTTDDESETTRILSTKPSDVQAASQPMDTGSPSVQSGSTGPAY